MTISEPPGRADDGDGHGVRKRLSVKSSRRAIIVCQRTISSDEIKGARNCHAYLKSRQPVLCGFRISSFKGNNLDTLIAIPDPNPNFSQT